MLILLEGTEPLPRCVGSVLSLPVDGQLEEFPRKRLRTGKWPGKRAVKRPSVKRHSQEKEGMWGLGPPREHPEGIWAETRGRRGELEVKATEKAGREILPNSWLWPKPSIRLPSYNQKHIHSSIISFIHSVTKVETPIEYGLCTKHKPSARSNTQTLTPGLTHRCRQSTTLINHECPPGLLQLVGQTHQHKMQCSRVILLIPSVLKTSVFYFPSRGLFAWS